MFPNPTEKCRRNGDIHPWYICIVYPSCPQIKAASNAAPPMRAPSVGLTAASSEVEELADGEVVEFESESETVEEAPVDSVPVVAFESLPVVALSVEDVVVVAPVAVNAVLPARLAKAALFALWRLEAAAAYDVWMLDRASLNAGPVAVTAASRDAFSAAKLLWAELYELRMEDICAASVAAGLGIVVAGFTTVVVDKSLWAAIRGARARSKRASNCIFAGNVGGE